MNTINGNKNIIRLLLIIIITLLINKVSFGQDTKSVDSFYLTDEEIEYLKQIEIQTKDSIKINFKGKKVLFTTGASGIEMISKKDFFDSRVKSVYVFDLSDSGIQNNTEYDLIITSSMKDLKWRVRRKVKKRLKKREKERNN